MGILIWIILGILAGAAAVYFSSERERANYGFNFLIGVVGAIVGGFVANLVTQNPAFSFSLSAFVVSILGAVVFLAVFTGIRRN